MREYTTENKMYHVGFVGECYIIAESQEEAMRIHSDRFPEYADKTVVIELVDPDMPMTRFLTSAEEWCKSGARGIVKEVAS